MWAFQQCGFHCKSVNSAKRGGKHGGVRDQTSRWMATQGLPNFPEILLHGVLIIAEKRGVLKHKRLISFQEVSVIR